MRVSVKDMIYSFLIYETAAIYKFFMNKMTFQSDIYLSVPYL